MVSVVVVTTQTVMQVGIDKMLTDDGVWMTRRELMCHNIVYVLLLILLIIVMIGVKLQQ